MYSNAEDFNDSEQPQYKKRDLQRACDICKRKKSDGMQMPGNRCSRCISRSLECIYCLPVSAKKLRQPEGYVNELEIRVEKLEKALTRVFSGSDILKEIDAAVDIDTWLIDGIPRPLTDSELSFTSAHTPQEKLRDDATNLATMIIGNIGKQHKEYPQDEDLAHMLLADHFKNLHIDSEDNSRFFGKSSPKTLVDSAIEVKNEYTGQNKQPILGSRREEFWIPRPWERTAPQLQKATFVFPDDDLIKSLLYLYFENFNVFLPLLHRPSFEKSVAEGLHLYDNGFGDNLLLVCAIAARLSDDTRVLMDGVQSCYSAGWKWFHQAQAHQVGTLLFGPPSLYGLQFYCLSVIFLQGSSTPLSSWTLVGIGIRLAQDVGAHRRRCDRNNITMEDELWKRAFWVLVVMDRMLSSAMGRPRAIQEEDFDVDLPIECDDEYWEHPDPSKRFKQPLNQPSYITGFTLLLKLNDIMAMVLRSIYSSNKHKAILGLVERDWNQRIIVALDSALNKWVDLVPDHLRWDPTREDTIFFQQSAWLYCTYYYIQILIHRSFIPSPRKPSPVSFPSLAICTNAARSCSHIVDIYHRRDLLAPPVMQMIISTAGIVLLLNIWGRKRSRLSTDSPNEMVHLHKCMEVLRRCEVRWPYAGHMWDILYELVSLSELPLPSANTPPRNKIDKDSDILASSSTYSRTSPTPISPGPLSSDELGRFPVSSQRQFGPAPQQTASMLEQGLGVLPMYWDTTELPTTQYGQMGFGYTSSPLAQSSYGIGSLGSGAAPMPLDQLPPELISGQGQYPSNMDPNTPSLIDNETFAMWSNAPSGFEFSDWEPYLKNFSQLTHGTYRPPAGA